MNFANTYSTTITKSNQITMTRLAREALGVKAGDQLTVEVKGDSIIIHRHLTDEEFFEQLDSMKSEKTKKKIKELAGKSVSDLRREWDNSPEGKKYYKEKYAL